MLKREKEVIQHQLDAEKEVVKDLERQYQAALNQINEKIRILQSDELTQSRIYQIQYQKALKGQVQGIIDKLHGDEYSTLQKYLHDCYTDAFVGTMYNLHGQGMPLILPIDQKAAVKAILTDSKISEGLYESLGVDAQKLKKTISSEITRGIASNLSYAEIARNISNVSKAPLSRAKSIANTEGHRIQQASTYDAQNEAKAKGADVVKQWDAVLDGATRPTHRKLDGQVREIDEPYEVDGKKAMFPGDFGDPAEDCRCRCVSLTRARAALDEDELERLEKRAEFFGLDKTKELNAFREKYVKAAEALKNPSERAIMRMGENYVSNKGFTIHRDKIDKFLLKPGSKHFDEFYSVGYRVGESNLLALTIENGYDESKATEIRKNGNGSESFSIFMNLGFGGGKRFRTVWQKDTPNSKPRLITAHRE